MGLIVDRDNTFRRAQYELPNQIWLECGKVRDYYYEMNSYLEENTWTLKAHNHLCRKFVQAKGRAGLKVEFQGRNNNTVGLVDCCQAVFTNKGYVTHGHYTDQDNLAPKPTNHRDQAAELLK